MPQLKDEAKARQLELKNLPKLKTDLLDRLVEGSIHVHESQQYKTYQALLAKLVTERSALVKESLQKKHVRLERQEQLAKERNARQEQKRLKEEQQKEALRRDEMTKQKSLHVHSFPRVHFHPLAKSSALLSHGNPRHVHGSCDCCYKSGRNDIWFFAPSAGNKKIVYSCETCNWDICQDCFNEENKSEAEKEQIRRRKADERRRQEEEAERRQQEEERRWNAQERFQQKILRPPAKQLDPNSSLKYTVWCSDGYDADGWHSYAGEPDKEFDSTWNTKKEANDRAEYLFFWKNSWGLDPNEVDDDEGDPKPTTRDGMMSWSVSPPDSTRWSVGVVPANVFEHLPNATKRRHNHDEERKPLCSF
jgi:hypothetical protein